jgi:glycosyltransferase involved in cell wall biosynthesis
VDRIATAPIRTGDDVFIGRNALSLEGVRRADEPARGELDILVLGPVPPPVGGVSMHLSRLVPVLQSAGFRVGVLNHFGSTEAPYVVASLNRNPFNYLRLPRRFRARLMHYHHSRWSTLIALAAGMRRDGTRYVITAHAPDVCDQLDLRLPVVPRLTRWALRRFDLAVAVNETIAARLRGAIPELRVEVVPAFLDASVDEAVSYDPAIEAFLDSGRVVLVAAYRVQFLRDGRDMYGLDTAAAGFAALAREREDVRLALFIAQGPSGRRTRRHLERVTGQLADARLAGRTIVAFGLPLVPAFRHDVVLLRPTRSDGDALSVREALAAGVPVVASDVVPRPDGVVTFAAEDLGALCTALASVLDAEPRVSRAAAPPAAEVGGAFVDRLIALYREQLAAAGPQNDA